MWKSIIILAAALLATTACQPKKSSQNSANAEQTAASTDGASADTGEQNAAKDTPKNTIDDAPDADPANEETAHTVASVESSDILARDPVTDHAEVQHVLISWNAQSQLYARRGGQDPRGAQRTKAQANELAKSILQKADDGTDFSALMREYSEDPGSAKSGRAYDVTPDASLVEPFKKLSLRLKPQEAGIVQSAFGYHIIYRVK